MSASAAVAPQLVQVSNLAVALGLSACIGLEREIRQKSAGLRTHTIVGLGAALFMLVSKYGFGDVLATGLVGLDPSRVAASIVSGIGFIGGGLIFVRRDTVRGLTTAATVWLAAAVGSAAGAGMLLVAAVCTVGHFFVIYVLGYVATRLPRSRPTAAQLKLTYLGGAGVLREVLVAATRRGFTVGEVFVDRVAGMPGRADVVPQNGHVDGVTSDAVSVAMVLAGAAPLTELVASLSDLPGVVTVSAGDTAEATE